MKQRVLAIMLLIYLLLSLCACGKKDVSATTNGTSTEVETTDGWIPSRVDLPDWLHHITGSSTEGDKIWLSGVTQEGDLAIMAYDTLSNEWSRVDFTTADAWQPAINSISLAGNSIWALMKESNRYDNYKKAQPEMERNSAIISCIST